jgi:hypothetical protein
MQEVIKRNATVVMDGVHRWCHSRLRPVDVAVTKHQITKAHQVCDRDIKGDYSGATPRLDMVSGGISVHGCATAFGVVNDTVS